MPLDSPRSLQTSDLSNGRVLADHSPQSSNQGVSVLNVILTIIVDRLVGRGERVGGTSIGVANVIVQVAVERSDDRTRSLRECKEVLSKLGSGSEGGTRCLVEFLTVNKPARVCRDRHEFKLKNKLTTEPVHELFHNGMSEWLAYRAPCIVR